MSVLRPIIHFSKASQESIDYFFNLDLICFHGALGVENADIIKQLFLKTVQNFEKVAFVFILQRKDLLLEIPLTEAAPKPIVLTTDLMLPMHINDVNQINPISSTLKITKGAYINRIETISGTSLVCNVGLQTDKEQDHSAIIDSLSKLTVYEYIDDRGKYNAEYLSLLKSFKSVSFVANRS